MSDDDIGILVVLSAALLVIVIFLLALAIVTLTGETVSNATCVNMHHVVSGHSAVVHYGKQTFDNVALVKCK